MTLTNELYLNCGIYNNGNIDILFIAEPGYFASTAWCESDEAYDNISGRKFESMTSDDGKMWLLERDKIRRLSKNDDVEFLLEHSCDNFKKIFTEKFL